MSMYNDVMFAQTNSEADSQTASCSNLQVHSVEAENVAPDASAYAKLPSALRQRMARRYEARGEEVPLHLRDPADVQESSGALDIIADVQESIPTLSEPIKSVDPFKEQPTIV